MGFLVVCEAGVGVGEHWVPVDNQPWPGAWPGPGVLGEVVNNGCRNQLLQKMGLLSAPPLSAHPILMLFLLVCYSCHPRVAQGIIPGPHLYKQSQSCVSQSFDSKHTGRTLRQALGEWALRGRACFGVEQPCPSPATAGCPS